MADKLIRIVVDMVSEIRLYLYVLEVTFPSNEVWWIRLFHNSWNVSFKVSKSSALEAEVGC